MTYTKGEWKDLGHSEIIMKGDDLKAMIRYVTSKDYKLKENEIKANARLISAAPDLLEALEDLIFHVINDGIPWNVLQVKIKKAQQAINKAEAKNNEHPRT